MRFGLIGSGFIVDWFVEAGRACEGFAVAACYSRRLEQAGANAKKYGAQYAFDTPEALAACPQVDAVYVASPTSLHYSHTMAALAAGKHVFCEKPIASNSTELAAMLAMAEEKGVLLLEAIRPTLAPGLATIRENMSRLGPIRRASFVYNQYSSRYDKFKQGIVENAFKPELSKGALMDIGTYCVHMLVALFGPPQCLRAMAVKLHNGVDAQGGVLCQYGDMLADISYSKVGDGVVPSVIQGELGSLTVHPLSTARYIEVHMRGQRVERIPINDVDNNMVFEIEQFMRLAGDRQAAGIYQKWSVEVMEILDEIRRQQGIVFPADLALQGEGGA